MAYESTKDTGNASRKEVVDWRRTFDEQRMRVILTVILGALWVAAATGCRTESGRTESELRARIEAFQSDVHEFISLGTPLTLGTANTEYVILHRKQAVPLLLEAVQDPKHFKKVGFAFYCLRKMRERSGFELACGVMNKLEAKAASGPLSGDEFFARNEARLYLKAVSEPSTTQGATNWQFSQPAPPDPMNGSWWPS